MPCIFTDGAYAESKFVDGKWRWVIYDFALDNFTALVGTDDDIVAMSEADTEKGLIADE